MTICGACGQENPAGFRFCGRCGAPLDAEPTAEREERKVVTVLFADLVGFTSQSERLDPEDVRSILGGYHAMLRSELERHGGTVEKFIGDAVMALFGAPVAHEDDPERAVRAALAIRGRLADERAGDGRDLHVRIGITTGTALVRLGARPEAGEGMAAGDVVNTAARIQSAAPVDGIVVDERTFRATERRIDYGLAEPVTAKGKSEPIRVWAALDAAARLGPDVARSARTPLVGRTHEVAVLRDALARVRRDLAPQLVTLIGVPGIGKSRLVYELLEIVDADEELIVWRQGRCLPYGEGASYRALGDIVKAQAGILESDDDDAALTKLRRALETLLSEPAEVDRVERHLRPLIGSAAAANAGHDEVFGAWRRFCEALAENGPAVLVFEDVHWADDGLLDFVEHLVDWAGGVPLLVLCVARPELLVRRADWGGGKANATTLSLAPLPDEDVARLVAFLLDRSVMPAELQTALLERAGGNPLYAEEFLRMAAEQGDPRLERIELPESIQAIVAARLDTLDAADKEIVSDAAVIGKVFWLGPLAASGRERAETERRLHDLERRQLIRRERRSSVAGEAEYSFWHVVIRDVAYEQIPRGERGRRHRAAAAWIAALAPDRSADRADLLAHHLVSALELAQATGASDVALESAAREALRAAGDHAAALSAYAPAAAHYGRALALSPPDAPDRPRLLLAHAHAVVRSRDEDVGLADAREALLAAGDRDGAAEAESLIGEHAWMRGRTDDAMTHARRAAQLVEDLPPSRSTAYVVGNLSRYLMIAGRAEEAITWSRKALALARQLGLADREAAALNHLGSARVVLGDLGGLDDIRESIALAERVGSAESVRGYINLASCLADLGELDESTQLHRRGDELARQFGDLRGIRFLAGELALDAFSAGDWEEALGRAEAFIAEIEEGQAHYWEGAMRLLRASLAVARADLASALSELATGVELARATNEPQAFLPGLSMQAFLLLDCGEHGGARRALDDLDETAQSAERSGVALHGSPWVYPAAFACEELGRFDVLRRYTRRDRWHEVLDLHRAGDHAAAAAELAGMGAVTHAARMRLRDAEVLSAAGRGAEAQVQLEQALAFYRSVGATLYLRRGERLLAASA